MINVMQIILLLINIESNGNSDAVGDNGKAIGCLQIHKCVVDDVNNFRTKKGIKKLYTYNDRYSMRESMKIAYEYLTHWVKADRLGRPITASDYALCWNQGPSWFKKQPNQSYLDKFNKQLKLNGFVSN